MQYNIQSTYQAGSDTAQADSENMGTWGTVTK